MFGIEPERIRAPQFAVYYTALTEELGKGALEEAGNKLGDLLKKKFGK